MTAKLQTSPPPHPPPEVVLLLREVYLAPEALVYLLLELGLQLLGGLQAVVCRAQQRAGGEQVVPVQAAEILGSVRAPESPQAQLAGAGGGNPGERSTVLRLASTKQMI